MGGRKGIAPVAFDPHTVACMEQLFEKQNTPTMDMLAELQCQCGDDIVRIRKWFRDRRYRERKIAPPQGVYTCEQDEESAPPPVLPEVQHHLLIRSDVAKSGYKGVITRDGRYTANCQTAPCGHNHLGSFGTPEDAAQAYLHHYERKHPKELEKERAPPVLPEVQHHLLLRSDKHRSGYKGVTASKGRYKANCTTGLCCKNHLGTFGTPEDAAQVFLQHQQQEHEHAVELNDMKPLAEEEEEEEGGHAVSTGKGNKRKEQPQPTPEMERLSDQLHSENQALKRCKQ